MAAGQAPAVKDPNDWQPVEPSDWQDVKAPAPPPAAASSPAPRAGSMMETIGNVGSHLKNLVTGPMHAFGDKPTDATEQGIAASPAGQMGLGAYRMAIKPTTDAIGTSVDQAKKGNIFSKNEYDAQGNYQPSAVSSAVDAIPVAGPWARNIETEAHQKGMMPALAGAAVDAAPAMAGEAMPFIGRGMQRVGGAVNDALIGTEEEGLRGATPGSQMAKEGIVGATPSRLTKMLNDRIPVAAAEHRGILANSPGGQASSINAGQALADSFDPVMAKATDPVTGAAPRPAIRKALQTKGDLSRIVDPATGENTTALRNPMLTPLDATNLKSSLYQRLNYDEPGKYNLANTGLKQYAHGLKSAVEQAVPESVEAGQRLHNLEAAKNALAPRLGNKLYPTSKGGVMERLAMGPATYATSKLFGAGDAMQDPFAAATAKAQTLTAGNRRRQ